MFLLQAVKAQPWCVEYVDISWYGLHWGPHRYSEVGCGAVCVIFDWSIASDRQYRIDLAARLLCIESVPSQLLR